MLDKQEINDAINHSASCWGLEPFRQQDHKSFLEKVLKLAVASLKQPSWVTDELNRNYTPIEMEKLPREIENAVRFVLTKELENAYGVFTDVVDNLNMDFEPFFRRIDKRTKEVMYLRRPEFERYQRRVLDPFRRFTASLLGAKEWYHKIWRSKEDCRLDGNVFEAIVAHFMEYSMACKCCMRRNTLRWNGGFDPALSSWSDVVCLACHSTYEIKSKANIEKVEKCFLHNEISGGSFNTYYKYYPDLRGSEKGKRYVVIVSRAASFTSAIGGLTHRVSIGEIDKVMPTFAPESFVVSDSRDIRIRSVVTFRASTIVKAWCQIPECKLDFQALAASAYESQFGPGTWNQNVIPKEMAPPAGHRAEAPVVSIKSVANNDLDSIRASLENIKIKSDNASDDDWEALYEDDKEE